MESDKCTALHRHRCRRAGHHVVITPAMVWVFVADGTDDGQLIGNLGQVGNDLAKLNSGDRGGNRTELAADFLGRIRLGVERLVMRRPAIHPDENAVDLLGTDIASSLSSSC